MGSFAGFLPLVSFKTAAYQSGAASQHIISAKQVWRTALKTTGRLFEQLALKETQQVQFKLVLRSSAFISAKRVWRTVLKSTERLFEQLMTTEAQLLKTTGRLFEQLALKETQQVQFKLVLLHIKSTRRFIWTIIHIVLPISSILKESH